MKIAISVPSGYHAREILLPLQTLLTNDDAITAVFVITPAAPWQTDLFPDFPPKFTWHSNPVSNSQHVALLAHLKPDLVLTPTIGLDLKDTPILQAARQCDIPTLTLITSWDNVFKIERLIQRGHAKKNASVTTNYVLPDYFAVWNELNAAHLQHLFPQLSPSRISVTGPPRFDYFAHSENIPTKPDLFRYLGIKLDPANTSLIHCATTELYPFAYIIKRISRATNHHRLVHAIQLYASVHPGGNMSHHRDYHLYGAITRYSFGRRASSPHPDFIYLPTTAEIYYLVSLFMHASLLINQSSTVAIESMRANVPVVNVMYGRPFDWWRWYRSMVYRDFQQHYRYITDQNGTLLVKRPSDLISAINSSLADPTTLHRERLQTVQKLITYSDGRCTQRLVDLAKKII